MSTLHKVKAYFGMAPMEDYDDEYYDDEDRPRAATPAAVTVSATTATTERPASPTSERPAPTTTTMTAPAAIAAATPTKRGSGRTSTGRGSARCAAPPAARWRWIPAGWRCCSTRAARCRRSPRCGPRTTARPHHRRAFRDGTPVIMDLVTMDNADAKRLVDFAGLAFALRGSFDKVATKVFLLSPADIDVSPDDRRRIAETGSTPTSSTAALTAGRVGWRRRAGAD